MAEAKSVLIIGGGVVGLCTAHACVKRGFRVTVLERGGPDHDGCSLGNAGLVGSSHFVPLAAPGTVALALRLLLNPAGPLALRPEANAELLSWAWRFYRAATREHVRRSAPLLRDLSLASRLAFERLAEELPDFGFTRQGLLMLCKRETTFHEEAALAKMAQSLGLEAEVLSPADTRGLEPGIEMEIAGAVYFPEDCHLDPRRLAAGLTRKLEERGVRFLWQTEATGWRARENRIEAVTIPQGELEADEYVVAGGSWSAALLRKLGLRLPLQAGKGYSVTLSDPPQRPVRSCILTEARVAMTPMGGDLRFAGTMELGRPDRAVNRRRVDGMLRGIAGYFPRFGPGCFQEPPVWSGLRPCSPDGLPYVGRTQRYRNLSIATGHAMIGVGLGPVTGTLMAEVLAGDPPAIDIGALSPDRYG